MITRRLDEATLSSKVERLKRRFIHYYVIITCTTLIVYILTFYYFMESLFMTMYFAAGLITLSYIYLIIEKKYTANGMMQVYMIVAPLYNTYIMLVFWETSVASFVTLFPVPVAAYLFLSKKECIRYLLYIIIISFICFFIRENFSIEFEKFPYHKLVITDILLFCFNLVIIILILFYHDRINKLYILSEFTSVKSEDKKSVVVQEEYEKEDIDEEIIERLQNLMENEMPFKNPNLSISTLSTYFDVNYTYISKIIRHLGYSNFNHFLNRYRINHVKMLMRESDLHKVTLMFIYTEAGFSNQATFNRVFKQMEGVTPSEYISLIKTEKLN